MSDFSHKQIKFAINFLIILLNGNLQGNFRLFYEHKLLAKKCQFASVKIVVKYLTKKFFN